MRSTLHRSLLVACSVIATSSVAAAASPQAFDLPDHGTLTLFVPDGWMGEMKQPRSQSPPTITMGPRSGPKFMIFITAGWPTASAGKLPDENAIRSEVAGAAKNVAPQSADGAPSLREIKGVDGGGFYFAATDRAPKPGEAKYLTQGIIRVGEISLAFTVLTNDGQEAVVRSALDMLRTAVHRPGSTP